MGIVFEMCNCSGPQKIIPNSKSMVENDINNKYDNNNNEEKAENGENIERINSTEEKKNKNKNNINNGVIINNEQNNDAETYNNISSKAVQKNKRDSSSSKKSKKKEDKLSQKESERKKEEIKNKKIKKKKSKGIDVDEKNNLNDKKVNSKKDNNNIINEEEFKEIHISDTILSEIVLNEKIKNIPKEKKKKIKGRNNINIVILGYNEVGKSTFCIRFVENKYEDFYIPSIGIENYTKIIAFNERNYKLNFTVLWGDINTQKQENIFSISDFFFLIYDITNIRSFNQINIYLSHLQKYLFLYDKEGKSPNFCLVGNKCDLEGERKVGLEIINKCIDKYGIKHFDISVRTAKNMNNLIQFFVNIFDKIAFSVK